MRNRTGIEEWILEKANYRHENTGEKFVFPYDLGTWENIKQVADWSCSPVGDGIYWTVRSGCNQYTLTVLCYYFGINRTSATVDAKCLFSFQIEQIAQKQEKRARTRTYTIKKCATGSWLPFWSQGFFVAVDIPCTDEPRIKLQIGDVVKVTRWKR